MLNFFLRKTIIDDDDVVFAGGDGNGEEHSTNQEGKMKGSDIDIETNEEIALWRAKAHKYKTKEIRTINHPLHSLTHSFSPNGSLSKSRKNNNLLLVLVAWNFISHTQQTKHI